MEGEWFSLLYLFNLARTSSPSRNLSVLYINLFTKEFLCRLLKKNFAISYLEKHGTCKLCFLWEWLFASRSIMKANLTVLSLSTFSTLNIFFITSMWLFQIIFLINSQNVLSDKYICFFFFFDMRGYSLENHGRCAIVFSTITYCALDFSDK